MKRIASILCFLLCCGLLHGQAQEMMGKPILRIFANYHHGITEDVKDESAFEVLRAYLGWEQHFNPNWKAVVKLDIGSPDDLSQYSLIRRYAYFKNAYIQYQNDRLRVGLGLVDMLHIGIPEKQWAHRYIRKEFQDQYKFAPKADIGAFVKYDFNDWLSVDGVLVNGEGYKNLQRDNAYKYGMGVTLTPIPGLLARFYYDITPKDVIQNSFSVYVGYNFRQKLTLGLDAAYQINHGHGLDEDLYGYSAFGFYNLNEKWEVFMRYDQLFSNIVEGGSVPWHLARDGTAIVGGFQYRATDFMKFALSYQDWFSYAQNGPDRSYIYLNMEVSF